MGTFLTNLHVRGEDQDAVEMALADADGLPAFVSDARGGWISVYPEPTESQDLAVIDDVASGLSKALATTVIAFVVHDSDVFFYQLCERGVVRDRYDSAPGYFDGEDRPPEGGDPAALLPLCLPGTTEAQLRRVLHEQLSDDDPAQAAGARAQARQMLVANYEQMARQLRTLGQTLPSLDEMLAQADGEGGGDVVFAERLAARLGALLGIAEERSLGSFHAAAGGQVPDGMRIVEPA
jgi:hypothetical protein